jgi:hypothetical protein
MWPGCTANSSQNRPIEAYSSGLTTPLKLGSPNCDDYLYLKYYKQNRHGVKAWQAIKMAPESGGQTLNPIGGKNYFSLFFDKT